MTAATMPDDGIVLSARGITKHYGGVKALKGVDFDIRAGRVTTLFGENGAGKSTLMRILSGVERPTSGSLELRGTPVQFASSSEALDQGIAIIHQELNLAPNLSVRDNIFLGRELRKPTGAIDYAAESEQVAALMERLEEAIRPDTPVSQLRLGQQQIVEIAGALLSEASILIMDEPTSALSAPEVEVLFRVIAELKAAGVAIVYISHHLEEALKITDYAVVFRDGAMAAQSPASGVDLPWVTEKMVGHALEKSMAGLAEPGDGEVLLSVANLVVEDPATAGRNVVDDVSLDVRAGEIVCLYGLMGAGRTELMEAVAGRAPIAAGRVTLEGKDVAGLSIQERIQDGLCLVPEDRQRDGLVQSLSIGRNMVLASLRAFTRHGFLNSKLERAQIARGQADTRVKMGAPTDLIGSLSGGNQQKVVVSKALLTEPRVMILDEPTRGIDVGARAEIFTLLEEQARQGVGVLFVTSEINEALNFSHRIIVMARGRIVREFATATAHRDQVMTASGETTGATAGQGATK
jgi:erythritol transport system ATP-binding protein